MCNILHGIIHPSCLLYRCIRIEVDLSLMLMLTFIVACQSIIVGSDIWGWGKQKPTCCNEMSQALLSNVMMMNMLMVLLVAAIALIRMTFFSNADGCKRLDKEEGTINPIIPRESENRCMT